MEHDAGAYRLQGIVMAVRAKGIEPADPQFDEAEVHDRQQRNVDTDEAHVFEICMQADTVTTVQEAVICAAEARRRLHVGLQHGMEHGRIEDGPYAEESGVDASPATIGIGEGAALRRDDAAAQICPKLDRADLEKIVIDSAGPTKRRNIIIDGTRISRFRRRLEIAKALGGEGPIDA